MGQKIQKRRPVIGVDGLASLTSNYVKHFSAYYKTRKQAVQQSVSAAV